MDADSLYRYGNVDFIYSPVLSPTSLFEGKTVGSHAITGINNYAFGNNILSHLFLVKTLQNNTLIGKNIMDSLASPFITQDNVCIGSHIMEGKIAGTERQ